MGQIQPTSPVMLILGAFSRYPAALAWARQRAEETFGPISLTSEVFSFTDTAYYERSMGGGLSKIFFAFENRIDPAALIEAKLLTNDWEAEFQAANTYPEPRPLNLDPGYLTAAKLVLATTKARDHRLYLGRGIYAEVTLHYRRGAGWQPWEWTYPDYRSPAYHAFFDRCRQHLRSH